MDRIAKREFTLDGTDRVEVELYAPVQTPHSDWECHFHFSDIFEDGYACGIDSVQAVELAIQRIGDVIREKSERYRWVYGERENDLGIYETLPTYLGYDFYEELKKELREKIDARVEYLKSSRESK